jgi:hypothetical protein
MRGKIMHARFEGPGVLLAPPTTTIPSRCRPGGLTLERSHEPYVFSHDRQADLWVTKVAGSMLSERIRQPDRFCSMQFDPSCDSGGLFCDMLELIPRRIDDVSLKRDLHALGRALVLSRSRRP